MIFLYFVYGLAFFSLGISLLIYPKKNSEFLLAATLWLIAFFGIFHGLHEWLQMFLLIQNPSEKVSIYLKAAELITLPVSFFFLVMFGTESVYRKHNHYSIVRALPAILFITWIFIDAAAGWNWVKMDIWARYLLGVPGIFLTSYVLVLQSAVFKAKLPSLAVNMTVAAVGLFVYGIFAGLVVPEGNFFPASFMNDKVFADKTGIPIQAIRTFCALVISYCMITMLHIFDFETKENLRNLSLKDELTGLLNRRGFVTLAEQQLKFANRLNRKLVLHSSDIDNLKRINDTRGHKEGDLAIVEVAEILKKSFRQSDIIARIGGDEFVMLQLEEINGDSKNAFERFQNNLDIFNAQGNHGYKILISTGTISCGPECQYSIMELLEKADKLMYEHKRSKQKS